MAFLGKTFDVNTLPEGNSGGFEPLPPGWYSATISGAELRETKDGTGEYIAVRYEITGPSHQGRIVFGNLNIKNKNPKAEAIAYQQLGDICRAIGLTQVSDSDELIGGQLFIKLKIREQEGYDPSNDIAGWKALGSSLPAAAAAPATASANGASKAPWAR